MAAVPRKGRGKPGPPQALDEKYLGRRLPGTPRQRAHLLETLETWLQDPQKGPKWVWDSRVRLMWEAEQVVNEGLPLTFEELRKEYEKKKADRKSKG